MNAGDEHRIPLFASRPAIAALIPEIAERQRAVLDSGRYVLGPELEAFEAEFARYIGRRHCIGVGSGTEAITIALQAHGIGPGDEVIVPAATFVASAEAVVHAGATPVFVDVDPETGCITATTVEPALTDRTRAILPVHLFGNVAPTEELTALAGDRGLLVVEDAAQAAGATYRGRRAGALGDVACFSFYPSKNLGGFGDGGAIVTDDDDVAERVRRLRHHGTAAPWRHVEVGYTSRLDELQAAALRVLLPHLDRWTSARRDAAAAYAAAGLGDLVRLPTPTAGADPAFHLYVVRSPRRDELAATLAERGIEARAYYTTPLHRQPAMASWRGSGQLLHAESLADEGLALPMGASLQQAAVKRVVDTVRASLESDT